MAMGHNIPLFFRFYLKLKHDIMMGYLDKGSKIKTIGELAKQHGISPISIRKGLDLLEMEGLLDRRQGWGILVHENADLRLFDLGVIITSKDVLSEVEKATIDVFSADWVEADSRLINLLDLEENSSRSVYKIYARVIFRAHYGFKTLITYCFSEEWMRDASIDESTPPRDIIRNVAKWMEVTPLRIKESLLPFLCTDENAKLLGLPDGTPVFHQTMVLKDRAAKKPSACFDLISSARVFIRELDIN